CDPQMYEALAAAAAAGGDFASAVSQQETAIRKARDLTWNTHAMEERLAAYKGGKAWQGDLFAGERGYLTSAVMTSSRAEWANKSQMSRKSTSARCSALNCSSGVSNAPRREWRHGRDSS